MKLPPISEAMLSRREAEAIASWHQERADNERLPYDERERHDLIAYRLFKRAHELRAA